MSSSIVHDLNGYAHDPGKESELTPAPHSLPHITEVHTRMSSLTIHDETEHTHEQETESGASPTSHFFPHKIDSHTRMSSTTVHDEDDHVLEPEKEPQDIPKKEPIQQQSKATQTDPQPAPKKEKDWVIHPKPFLGPQRMTEWSFVWTTTNRCRRLSELSTEVFGPRNETWEEANAIDGIKRSTPWQRVRNRFLSKKNLKGDKELKGEAEPEMQVTTQTVRFLRARLGVYVMVWRYGLTIID